MIQLQALNYIINKKDADFLTLYDVRYYFNYKDEYNFIKKHYEKFKTIPDISTVLDRFSDFTPMDISESTTYISQRLYEEYVYNEAVTTINDSTELFSKDAVKAKNDIITKLSSLEPPKRNYGTDIIKTAKDRYDLLIDKMANHDEYTFSTGLEELDLILGGIRRKEELILLYARTNNAKTWIAEKLAVSVWSQKHGVGFFSPEMSDIEIGYRFDTLFKNFDNKGITTGSLDDSDNDKYKRYINSLVKKDRPTFSVTSPLNFPDKKVTVSEIKKWVDEENLKMVVIDGLQYMTNERSNGRKNTTENLTELSEDLMLLSMEKNIPIVIVLQANRMGARDSSGEVSKESPEIDTIRGSDGISHNASRCISLFKDKDIIKMYISKNRYGEKGQHLYYQYDINTGKFTYVANPKDGLALDSDDSARDDFKDSTEVF